MRALVVYAHPNPESYTAAVRDVVTAGLEAAGAEMRLIDLYAEGFSPAMALPEYTAHFDTTQNRAPVEAHAEALLWCDTLVFVYPTWWYGLPAMLKGWLDRVMLPGVAFHLPDQGDIKPGLTHITRLGVFTTCGASRWLNWYIGQPGRRTLQRGVGLLCARPLKTCYEVHYEMDASTPASRARHLEKVARRIVRFAS
jgi:putative NADPH-quinone reductase